MNRPIVSLIGRPAFEVETFVSLLRSQNLTWERTPAVAQAEELVEAAGRICYLSFGSRQSPKTNSEYVAHLIQQGHESVFEHVNWTFLLTGVSRAFSHQLVRHRVGFAFSQLSQQYHDESSAAFVEPAELAKVPEAAALWKASIEASRLAYQQVLNSLASQTNAKERLPVKERLRAIRSTARSLLPNATETKLIMTANGRALRHFLILRGAIRGDTEMRQVCAALLTVLNAEAPSLFQDFTISTLEDGLPIVDQRR